MKRVVISFLLIAIWAGVALSQTVHTVGLQGNKFDPDVLTIQQGDSVRFRWVNGLHNVAEVESATATTYMEGGALSGVLERKGDFTVLFPDLGTRHFICENHVGAGMRAAITVVEVSTTGSVETTETVGTTGSSETEEPVGTTGSSDTEEPVGTTGSSDTETSGTATETEDPTGAVSTTGETADPSETSTTGETVSGSTGSQTNDTTETGDITESGTTGTDIIETSTTGSTSEPRTIDVLGSDASLTWDPSNITIVEGDTVRWEWDGLHNVIEIDGETGQPVDGGFTSGMPTNNGTFSHTFTTAGVYHFACELHITDDMVGVVTVVANSQETTEGSSNPAPLDPASVSSGPRLSAPFIVALAAIAVTLFQLF